MLAGSDKIKLSDEQAKAILDLRLQRLTALGRDEIKAELDGLGKEIAEYLEILRSRLRIRGIVKDELATIKKEFGTPRKTEITEGGAEVEEEDLIQREDMVVTVTLGGYIKRTPLEAFRTQARGGKGRAGMATKEEDAVTNLFVTSTHNPVLFFSTHGKVYRLKVWRLPEGAPQARGRPMVNLLPLAEGETISTVLPLPEDEAEWSKLHVIFATAHGGVRRNSMDYETLRLVTAAISRVDAGEYGSCMNCDEPISARRLAALPWAEYCVVCQEQFSGESAGNNGRYVPSAAH